MGKYLDRKASIESTMKHSVDKLVDRFNADMEATNKLNFEEQMKQRAILIEAHNRAISEAQERAIEAESKLFDEIRADTKKALGKVPSEAQIQYMNMLSMKPSITRSDVEAAVSVVQGNPLAEATLFSLAEKHGVSIPLSLNEQPQLDKIISGLDEFQESRATYIRAYGKVDRNGKAVNEWLQSLFSPEGSHTAFNNAEQVISDYGEAE